MDTPEVTLQPARPDTAKDELLALITNLRQLQQTTRDMAPKLQTACQCPAFATHMRRMRQRVDGIISTLDAAVKGRRESLDHVEVYASDRQTGRSLQEEVQTSQAAPAITEHQRHARNETRKSLQEEVQTSQTATAITERRDRHAQNDVNITTATSTEKSPFIVGSVRCTPSDGTIDLIERAALGMALTERRQRHAHSNRDIATATSAKKTPFIVGSASYTPLVAAIKMIERATSRIASKHIDTLITEGCTACGGHVTYSADWYLSDLPLARCKHDYCRECIKRMFKAALKDESLYPPRCCGRAIPVDAYRQFLDDDLIQKLKKRAVELSTPNRTYCHKPSCSSFIEPERIEDRVANCPECRSQTCITCKGAAHAGDCPNDEDLQKFLALARSEEWQSCPMCSIMVERIDGCASIE